MAESRYPCSVVRVACPAAKGETMASEFARCNLDGRPIHPGDQAQLDQFKKWLACTPEERRDPRWHEFLGITPGDAPGQESLPDLFRDVHDLANQVADRVTDAEVDARLRDVLHRAGYADQP